MRAVTEILDDGVDSRVITKRFLFDHIHGEPHYKLESKYLPMLAEAGIGPQIYEIGEDYIVMEKLIDFTKWLDPHARVRNRPAREIKEMGVKVHERIRALNDLGIAHRDIHHRNILFDRELKPYFIDMELSCDADVGSVSYDLHGPSHSGIAPPEIHTALKVEVWWDSTSGGAQTAGRLFGDLLHYNSETY